LSVPLNLLGGFPILVISKWSSWMLCLPLFGGCGSPNAGWCNVSVCIGLSFMVGWIENGNWVCNLGSSCCVLLAPFSGVRP
jgi:hypothetical protein